MDYVALCLCLLVILELIRHIYLQNILILPALIAHRLGLNQTSLAVERTVFNTL